MTISGGPDFAYRLCLDRISAAQLDELDLSTWRVAYTGAEPVRHDTMDAFIERYVPVGFCAGAVYPCYGLAEATLLVTGGRRGDGMLVQHFDSEALARRQVMPDTNGVAQVSCGVVPSEHALAIIDPLTGNIAADGSVGEIWAAGESIAAGYWNKARETAEAFVERDGQRWLRTGDLGFVHDGQLFVAGRLKDMIIVRGHNLYPQDIERAVEAEVEAVRKGRVAAFAVTIDGVEGIGIAAEVSRGLQKLIPPQALMDALSVTISEQCGEAPKAVVLLNPGALPKTSSGKLQRSACRQGYVERSLDAYALFENGMSVAGVGAVSESVSATGAEIQDELTRALTDIWRDVLGHDVARQYADKAHFFALGGNSLSAVQLVARVAQQWAVELPVGQVFEQPRLQQQTELIRASVKSGIRLSLPVIPVLPAERRVAALPLSSAQRRQWFLWKFDPHSTAYHIQLALRISGAVNIDAMRTAVAGLAARHESLRTVFRARPDGEVEQFVLTDATLELDVVDLRDEASGEREIRAAAVLRTLHTKPFNLTSGPLIRAALVRVNDRQQILALAMHHIVSDGASMQILLDELVGLYRNACEGAPALPTPQLQYADFAAWQQDSPEVERHQRQQAYWLKQLAVADGAAQPVLALPADRPRQAVARYRAGQHSFALSQELLAGLRQATEQHGVTQFMLLLTAFQTLLYRYTGQQDIRVGVPVANRTRAELQGIVGFFVNTLVIRNRIGSRKCLSEILVQAKDAVLGAQTHQDFPFEQLVEALQPERSLAHSPLFQVLFNYLREDYRAVQQVPDWSVAAEPVAALDAQFELSVELREHKDGGVRVTLVYAEDLFDAVTMERFALHYIAMLNALARHAEVAVADVELLTAEDRGQLAQWSRNDEALADGQIVHRLFEQQVLRSPDAIALCFGDARLRYGELNARANRLAHHLVGLQVKPGALVGIAMERSVEMVVGLLAILKAGAVYVPIDPEYPSDRIAYMLADSGVRLVLTQRHVRNSLPAVAGLELIDVDTFDFQQGSDANPNIALHGESLVYVIYTSGSTGRPKGAANRHRSVCNRLLWGQQHQPLDVNDTVLQKTPFSFDISFWEFFWPLTTGARLALAGPGEHRDPQRLVALINQYEITTIHFVPSMLQAFMAFDGVAKCQGLKRIICSGEALPASLQTLVLNAFPDATLLNLYGPTEAAIEVAYWDCTDKDALAVPIGRPIAGLSTHVLDDELNEVPRGVAGELHLGGLGLARGYWQRPGLTAERFVADPARNVGERLYRTGDLVRWRSDGQLEYLGRIDHQVKIRGFRIELGEVEAELREQPTVREAVVVAHEGTSGTRLVAYVSPHAEEVLDSAHLKAALATTLPDYMIPSAIIVLDNLPLNSNGKVDRKALPAPELSVRAPYEMPAGEIAKALAAIWAEILGVERVSASDNFFDLGGHSLHLVKVQALLELRLQAGLSTLDLFKHPTVSALAQRIEQGGDDSAQAATQKESDVAQRRRAAMLQRKRAVSTPKAERIV
ncbi:MAG TPA: amino acid adenylation domain-containing protein [Dongiaceae bacterium]|nr:amino acid adenylation domain-containing protein [Dongiaceae bacterium]